MTKILDGLQITNREGFYKYLVILLDLRYDFGNNLDALWDSMSTDVERPLNLIWENSDYSHARMGDYFDRIVEVFRKVEEFDSNTSWSDVFSLTLK